jgi:hypothetical protein
MEKSFGRNGKRLPSTVGIPLPTEGMIRLKVMISGLIRTGLNELPLQG